MAEPPLANGELLALLRELAFDLRWTWSHEADALWVELDPEFWESAHNPWTLLNNLRPGRLEELARDPRFTGRVQELVDTRRADLTRTTWFERAGLAPAVHEVAYFSMEFGLGAALPLYAGGLGVLAGDILKTASDLGAPVIGVGLLYQDGYFRQVLDGAGGQRETYPVVDPADMPIRPAVVDGAWARVPISLPGRELQLRVWQAQVGRSTLYLLDSNDPKNSAADRGVTAQLYGGDAETRLLQELALGVGGWRVLERLGHDVEVCHINEGHAAFVVIERATRLAERAGLTFDEALWATRAGNVFTTHTPVAAGFDRFDPGLLQRYLRALDGRAASDDDGLRRLLALGRVDPDDAAEPFNMAYLAMRGSARCFAVSQVHGEVSRTIFQPLFPRWPRAQVPIGHVTNGVHTPTWDSAEADELWTAACGKDRWRFPAQVSPPQIARLRDEDIWDMRGRSRAVLVGHVRRRLASQLAKRGFEGAAAEVAETVLDPNILTLGFARRFTDYKRPNLLLGDMQRLTAILLNQERPAQLVLAGKAHPSDSAGKQMIREWIGLAMQPHLRPRIVFLEDYDLGLAQEIVQGVDVWLNTPRPPSEACGTSGMKVLVNGGLNCSVLDGWWAEAYMPALGWAIDAGPGREGADLDQRDAEALYRLIEEEIAPEFYDRDPRGLPRAWVTRIRHSMFELTARFSSARMLREYIETAYAPAANSLRERASDKWAMAKDLAQWSERLMRHWNGIDLGAPSVTQVGGSWRFSIAAVLGEIGPEAVRLELYADAEDGSAQVTPLRQADSIPGSSNGYVFVGETPASRPATEFTVRVTANRPGVRTPSEIALIRWQR